MQIVKCLNVNAKDMTPGAEPDMRECVAILPGRNMAQAFIDANPQLVDPRIGYSIIAILETSMETPTIDVIII